MEGVRGQEQRPGEFRRIPNLIGHRGATPETPASCRLRSKRCIGPRGLRLIYRRSPQQPTIPRSASLVHYQFEAIHPFMDGPGRLDRCLSSCCFEPGVSPRRSLSQRLFRRTQCADRDRLLDVSRDGSWMLDRLFPPRACCSAHGTAQRAYSTAGPSGGQSWRSSWIADHGNLHGYTAIRDQLMTPFREQFFTWRPYLYRYGLHESLEPLERALIEEGRHPGYRIPLGGRVLMRAENIGGWIADRIRAGLCSRQRSSLPSTAPPLIGSAQCPARSGRR